jgi:hypothetical protein
MKKMILIAAGAVFAARLVWAQTPVLFYDWTNDYVTANRNLSRTWVAGTNVTRVIPFSDTQPLSPTNNYTGPLFYGAASYLATGTVDGTISVTITGTPTARVSNSANGDEVYSSITCSTITNGGYLGVEGAVLYYFKTNTPFQVGDTSLRFTVGTYAHLSRLQWVLRDAAGTFFVSDMSIRITNTFTRFLSNELTTRRWAVFDPTQENLCDAAGEYGFPDAVGLDFAQITGAGVLITTRAILTNSGNRTLTASIRRFEALPHDPARDAAQLSAYYFGNSLTESTWPDRHPALGDSAGKTWESYKKTGAGWELWQHRYELYVGGQLDPGSSGEYTIDPDAVGDSSTQIQDFISRPWEAMTLQLFGDVMWPEVVTQKWDVVFPEPTDISDVQSATDIIAVYLAYNPAGKVGIYPTWRRVPSANVPPQDQWPEWTQYYSKTNEFVVGQPHTEFHITNANEFAYATKYFDFYQNENPPWTNGRNGTRDYEHKVFAELIARHTNLWAQGRLTLIPIRTIFNRLDEFFKAGGDPELNNPDVPEKIYGIVDFYTDTIHIRAGLPQFVAAASFYTAFFGAHPGVLDWSLYNRPNDYASDPYHDRFPTLSNTAARAEAVCDIIWDEFCNNPFSALRVSPFTATERGAPDTFHLWGANDYGQIGRENYPSIVSLPEPLTGDFSIVPGPGYAFAVKSDGSMLGWGRNHRGQLGDATFVGRAFPYRVVLLPSVRQIVPGKNHAAAVTQGGEIWAWGANDDGQLGDNFGRNGHTIEGFPVPPENARPRLVAGLPANATGVACGTNFTVACFSDGTVWSWGRGQSAPAQVTNLPAIAAVTAGDAFTLALANNGTVWAWGANEAGQLGLGDTTERVAPVQIPGLSGISNVVAGSAHALALATNGALYVWGDNSAGQLGLTGARWSPTALDLGMAVREIAAGAAHSAARLANRSLWTWGANESGQLGDGTTVSRSTPQQVLDRVASVRAAGSQTAALTAPPRPTFAAWQAAKFASGEISGGQAAAGVDFDGDGRANLLEYIQQTDPRNGDSAPVWTCRREGDEFVFETEYLAADYSVSISWETSTDLAQWNPAAPTSAQFIPNDDTERAVLRFAIGPSQDRLFLRMKIGMVE